MHGMCSSERPFEQSGVVNSMNFPRFLSIMTTQQKREREDLFLKRFFKILHFYYSIVFIPAPSGNEERKIDNSGHSCVFLRVDPFSPIASFFFVVVTTVERRDKGTAKKQMKKKSQWFFFQLYSNQNKSILKKLEQLCQPFFYDFLALTEKPI